MGYISSSYSFSSLIRVYSHSLCSIPEYLAPPRSTNDIFSSLILLASRSSSSNPTASLKKGTTLFIPSFIKVTHLSRNDISASKSSKTSNPNNKSTPPVFSNTTRSTSTRASPIRNSTPLILPNILTDPTPVAMPEYPLSIECDNPHRIAAGREMTVACAPVSIKADMDDRVDGTVHGSRSRRLLLPHPPPPPRFEDDGGSESYNRDGESGRTGGTHDARASPPSRIVARRWNAVEARVDGWRRNDRMVSTGNVAVLFMTLKIFWW
mmetsp:Transcript_26539/g.32115  ORF Transcript_26539/g.32115 Transcript_26539/m.32115 type:complete len:266 (+) Transcript_26539:92-889(+)